ncbi:hypothetical protein H5968_20460 [Sphaerospermopsis sp. LEGE 00249]|nr:hypothetical protein [Sphaerospermopsis sp. LEGE 00249]
MTAMGFDEMVDEMVDVVGVDGVGLDEIGVDGVGVDGVDASKCDGSGNISACTSLK